MCAIGETLAQLCWDQNQLFDWRGDGGSVGKMEATRESL